MNETTIERPDWSRILVRLPNWVGDVVMATPALRALRGAFPDAFLAAAVRSPAAPLLNGTRLVDEVISIQKNEEQGLAGAMRYARRLRSFGFDGAVLLTNSLTTAIPPFLARIPARVGYAGDWRRGLLTRWGRPERLGRERKPIPMPDYYQRVLDLCGVPSAGSAYELPVLEVDREAAREVLVALGWDGQGSLAGINPGASFGSSKLWSIERLATLARDLRERRGLLPVVLCGPAEVELGRSLAQLIGEPVVDTSRSVVDLKTLRGVLQLVEVLVTTDTGPRHVAVAMDRPVAVIMGPTWPQWTACNLEKTRVLRQDVPCGPCHLKICPLEEQICMTRVTSAEVLAAVEELLGAGS